MIFEPKWKSYCVHTNSPIFTPLQCKMVIEAGREEPRKTAEIGADQKEGILDTETRTSHISWIPFKKMPEMYKDIEKIMKITNSNQLIKEGQAVKLKQGQAVFFASFIRHRVAPVTKGIRRSLVMWFGGPAFK